MGPFVSPGLSRKEETTFHLSPRGVRAWTRFHKQQKSGEAGQRKTVQSEVN